MANETVVVTGAHGFIGRHLSRYFSRRGSRVVGIGHGTFAPEEAHAWGLAEWHSCDVTLETLREHAGSPEVLLHFAGGSLVGRSVQDPRDDFRRTVDTTMDMLEFVRRHSPQTRIVYPSSAAVYGIARTLPISETAPLQPLSPYGIHKKVAEDLFAYYATTHGIAVAVVRFFSVYGPGLRKQLLWDVCNRMGEERPIFWGTGSETRDWLHVEDAVQLCDLAASRASSRVPVVNGGTGAEVEVREVLAEVFADFGRVDGPAFSGKTKPGDPQHYKADIALATGWGWKPRIQWRDGLRDYIRWYKERR